MTLMVTEISPVFGLSLLDMLEILTVIAGFGSFAVALGIWKTYNRQKNIDSARLLLELREQLKECVFMKITSQIYAGKSSECDPTQLERYLNHLDVMASFKEDGLIKTEHIELHAGLFLKIKEDEYVQKYMDRLGKDLYGPLRRLISSL